MSGNITVTADPVNYKIGVSLASWATTGPVSVYRVHPDSSQYLVRSTPDVSGGVSFVNDYEAPFGVAVTYQAYDGATLVQSGSVTLSVTTMMLKTPGLPSTNATFELVEKPVVARPRARAVLYPIGRDTAVPIGTLRTKAEFNLKIETHSEAEAQALEQVLIQKVSLLLLLPGYRRPFMYVDVGDVREEPFETWLSLNDGDPGSWLTWTLPCVQVDRPVGEVYGDPAATLALVNSTYATLQALLTAKPTLLDILKGVP